MSKYFGKKKQQLIGIDIGSRFVKAVLLSEEKDKLVIDAIACEKIHGDAFQEREIKEMEAVSNALTKVSKLLKTKVKDAVLAVSGATVLTKLIQMDMGQTDVELESQIEIEADSLIPYPIDEVYLDFEEMGPCSTNAAKCDVLLSVAHKNTVDSRIMLAEECGFEPKILDIEGYALGNSFLQLNKAQTDEVSFCISIGAAQLQLTVLQNEQILMSRELGFGTDALLADFGMMFGMDKTEAGKRLAEQDFPDGWKESVYPQFLSNLQMQISRILQLYVSTYNEEMPNKLYVCGGGCGLPGLIDDLAMDMNMEVVAFDPLESLTCAPKVSTDSLWGPQFAIAIGLACRSFNLCHI